MNWLRTRIGKAPRQATILGKTLFLAGAILILGAVFARASLLGINADRADAKLPLFQGLAEAYPDLPTWIVPEGPLGYTIATVLVLAGMALVILGDEARKKEKASRAARW